MDIYSVHFKGHYAVGAVAVVKAFNEIDAKARVLAHLNMTDSYLAATNAPDDLKVELLTFPTSTNVFCVHILLDGKY